MGSPVPLGQNKESLTGGSSEATPKGWQQRKWSSSSGFGGSEQQPGSK